MEKRFLVMIVAHWKTHSCNYNSWKLHFHYFSFSTLSLKWKLKLLPLYNSTLKKMSVNNKLGLSKERKLQFSLDLSVKNIFLQLCQMQLSGETWRSQNTHSRNIFIPFTKWHFNIKGNWIFQNSREFDGDWNTWQFSHI